MLPIRRRTWILVLAALVSLRAALALVPLALEDDPPGVPAYDYEPLRGDANGFYAAAREILASLGRLGLPLLALLGLGLVVAAYAAQRLWRGGRRWQAVALGAWASGLAAAVLVDDVPPSGAAVIGWPLLWAVPMLPLRAAGVLDEDTAFAVGLPLQLLANGVTVVATAYAALYATRRWAAGLLAAALYACWPLLTWPLAGPSAWENGQWHVDVGLHLYTEPISTALVTTALALLLSPRLDDQRLALAGAALGFATVVRVSNGFFALLAVALVALRLGWRRSVPIAVAGLAFAPLVAVYWPKGYPEIPNVPTLSLGHVTRNWSDSLLYTPLLLALLLPLALLGALVLRPRWPVALLGGVVLANVAFYSFYGHTHLHPRFLYVTLPAVFVLLAAGAVAVGRWISSRRGYPSPG